MNEITMIPIESLRHHPENPRSDLGDLTEMAASIQAQGILQNLTVIPAPDSSTEYWVVIGNRRLEAAKKAGIKMLPCKIADMDDKTAMRTMMSENMQRQDLTVLDQVYGIGRMQQLGMTLPEIAEGTGLSESTVRKRVSIGKLPKKSLEKACNQGATLMDLLEVTTIESEKSQKQVLEAFGSNNFNYLLMQAKEKEKQAKFKADILPKITALYPKIKTLADNECWSGEWKEIKDWRMGDREMAPVPEPKPGEKYGIYQRDTSVTLYARDMEWVNQKKTEKDNRQYMKELSETAKTLNRQAFDLRASFIRGFRLKSEKERLTFFRMLINEGMNWKSFTQGVGYYKSSWDAQLIREILNIPYESERDKEEPFEKELMRRGILKDTFILAWAVSGGITSPVRATDGWCNDYNGSWKPCEDLEAAYRILENLGYQMSDFEKSLRDKTHEFFRREQE